MTHFVCPFNAATWTGVYPVGVSAFRSAQLIASHFTNSMCPKAAARWRAEDPLSSLALEKQTYGGTEEGARGRLLASEWYIKHQQGFVFVSKSGPLNEAQINEIMDFEFQKFTAIRGKMLKFKDSVVVEIVWSPLRPAFNHSTYSISPWLWLTRTITRLRSPVLEASCIQAPCASLFCSSARWRAFSSSVLRAASMPA
jgi:hypothetical protein